MSRRDRGGGERAAKSRPDADLLPDTQREGERMPKRREGPKVKVAATFKGGIKKV